MWPQRAVAQHAATMHDYGLATRLNFGEPRRRRADGACLVGGCPCKDPRIVSHRRAAFFAAVAREHGETADRSIVVEPDWRIPTLTV
jgi:hypothetical protein